MSWSWPNDGVDRYAVTDIGSAPVAGAPVSVIMMVKPTTSDNGFMVATASGTDCYGVLATSGGKLFAVNDFSAGGPTLVLNEWQVVGFDDDNAGSGTLRWHHCTDLAGTPTWAHADGPASGNRSGTPTTFRLGLGAAAFRMRGLIAAIAVASGRLGDAGFEALGVTTMANWVAAAEAAWQMNVAVGSTALEDLTGGTADQTSLVGTPTLSGDDPPNWVYFTATTDVSGTDTGTLTDDATLAAALADTDTGTLTDTATLAAALGLVDSGAMDDAGSLTAQNPGVDTLTVTDVAALSVLLTDADSAALTELAALAAAIVGTDSAAMAESATVDKGPVVSAPLMGGTAVVMTLGGTAVVY